MRVLSKVYLENIQKEQNERQRHFINPNPRTQKAVLPLLFLSSIWSLLSLLFLCLYFLVDNLLLPLLPEVRMNDYARLCVCL